MKPHNKRRAARMAIGLPGRPASPQACQLAAVGPAMGSLPRGRLWHVSDHSAPLLATCQPTISDAKHIPTGEPFLLASAPDGQVVAVSATTDDGQRLIMRHWADPVAWARREAWWIDPASTGART